MPYYTIAGKVSLDDLKKRIRETDLIPSRISLLDKIDENFSKLKKNSFSTLEDLRENLKNAAKISLVSKQTEIDVSYLTLLRREFEGYFPKPFPIKTFDWLPKNDLTKLENAGLKNSVLLYEALENAKRKNEIITTLELEKKFIDEILSLVALTKIQWTSPLTARMLIAAGYDSVKKVAEAEANKLCDSLDSVNKTYKFFKGKIGLRDIQRLIKAASYVE